MTAFARVYAVSILTVWLIMSQAAIADAAGSGCDTDKEWCPPSAGPINTWTAPVCEKGRLLIQPFLFYNRARGVFNSEGHYKSFKDKETKSEYQFQLFAEYGITDRLEIAAQGIYQEKLHHKDGINAESYGFGDTYIYSRYCLIDDSGYIPHVTALFQFKLPTGKYQKLDEGRLETDFMGADSGGGSYDHGYGVNISKKMKPVMLHADFIYGFPIMTKVNGVKVKYGNYVNYDFGVEYFLPKGFNLMLEFNGFLQDDRRDDGEMIPSSDSAYLNIVPGIGWSCEKIQMLLAYQRTLAGANAEVKDSVIFTFVYTF